MSHAGPSERDWRQTGQDALAEELTLGFPAFSYADAWQLGQRMVAEAMAREYPVAIAIGFGVQRVFHAALPGSAATNDHWLDRKFRAVAVHDCSSWVLACQQRAEGGDYFAQGGYERAQIALAGGAVPLRVQGSLIGAVGVSGLAEEDDHRFVVQALKDYQEVVTSSAGP